MKYVIRHTPRPDPCNDHRDPHQRSQERECLRRNRRDPRRPHRDQADQQSDRQRHPNHSLRDHCALMFQPMQRHASMHRGSQKERQCFDCQVSSNSSRHASSTLRRQQILFPAQENARFITVIHSQHGSSSSLPEPEPGAYTTEFVQPGVGSKKGPSVPHIGALHLPLLADVGSRCGRTWVPPSA